MHPFFRSLGLGVLMLCLLTTNANATASAIAGALTVKEFFNGMDDSIEKAKQSGIEVVVEAATHAQSILDKIKLDYVDVMDKRVNEISETLQRELRTVELVVGRSLESINTLPQCMGNEVGYASAALRAGLDASLDRVPVIKKGQPTALLVHEQGARRPYVARADQPHKMLVIKGVNFWREKDVCEIQARLDPVDNAAKSIPLSIRSTSPEEFILLAAEGIAAGGYIVNVSARPKRAWWQFGGCGEPESVAVPLQAMPIEQLAVTVKATPYCKVEDTYTYQCAGSLDAGSCRDGAKRDTRTCVFDRIDYKLQNYSLRIVRNHRGGARATRTGNNVTVNYYASKRGDFCRHGTGEIAWNLSMIGTKPGQPKLGSSITSQPLTVQANQDATFALPAPAPNCQIEGWVVEATAKDAKAERILALGPQKSDDHGNFSLVNRSLKLDVEFPSRKGTLRMEPSSCLDY